MTDIESRIDRDIERAVRALTASDVSNWIVGRIAAPYLGTYSGVIKAIAEAKHRDPSTIENYCHAWELYNVLRSYGNVTAFAVTELVWKLRKNLTISHFSAMWELQRKYGLNDDKVYVYLSDADKYDYSSRDLRREVEAHEQKDGNAITWDWARKPFRGWLVKVAAMNTPGRVGALVQELLNELEEG
jgi:hypothetical protein